MVLISLVPALTPLYLYVSTFRSMCAVPNMAVFCSSLISWFPAMLLTYFLNDFEMVPVAPIITGITFAFTLLFLLLAMVVGPLAVLIVVEHVTVIYCGRNAVKTYNIVRYDVII